MNMDAYFQDDENGKYEEDEEDNWWYLAWYS